MVANIKKHWFSIGLVLAFAAVILDFSGILVNVGVFVKKNHFPEGMIFLIFIISGLLIDSHQIKSGLKDMSATLAALSVILVFAPAISLVFALLPMETGTVIGLFIVAVMPTTLSSGVVMTKTAGGNMAHALFITIVSNIIGIFSIPLILPWMLSFLDQNKELTIDHTQILFRLVTLVLVPLLIGMSAKAFALKKINLPGTNLQVINQCMIIAIVFISIAGSRQTLMDNGPAFFYILALVSVFHLLLLGTSALLVRMLDIPKGRYESVIFMGSQKTLALSAIIQMTYFGEFGTALLVCVVHHIVHLMMDGYLSMRMHQGGST